MKIVVTGSLGHISKPLAIDLVEKGHEVIVISSNSDRQSDIEKIGAKAAIGSLEDVDFIAKTFTAADAVYCMIPPNSNVENQLKYYQTIGNNYKDAIEKSGVKRVVHLSSWGANQSEGTGIILGSNAVETILNNLESAKVTNLRATSLMYNLYSFLPIIKHAGMISANYGEDDKIAWVHPNDIAVAAAEELVKIDNINNIRYVSSDEKTANESAKIIGEAIGKPDLKWHLITDEEQKQNLMNYGLNENIASGVTDLYRSIHNGVLAEDYNKNKPQLSPTKLEEFAKEFAAVYQKK